MSYQFQPPAPSAPVGAPPVAAAPVASAGKPKRLLLGVGAIALVGGLAAGGVCYGKSTGAVDRTVASFARAPVGCTTTLEFDRADTFTLFVETKGTAPDSGGDCAGNGQAFEHTGSDVPKVNLSLTDSGDQPVKLTAFTGYSYDTSNFRGSAVQQVTISKPGTYRLTVTSASKDVGVAVGGDPEVDQSRLQLIAIASAVGGLVVGIALMFLGRPKKTPPPVAAPAAVAPAPQASYTAPTWTPAPQAPAPAPVAPPPPPAAPGQGWGAPQT